MFENARVESLVTYLTTESGGVAPTSITLPKEARIEFGEVFGIKVEEGPIGVSFPPEKFRGTFDMATLKAMQTLERFVLERQG